MRQFLLGLSFSIVFMVGCAVGTMQGSQVAQAQAGGGWEVKCEMADKKVAELGATGWEPFAAYTVPGAQHSICFRRPLP